MKIQIVVYPEQENGPISISHDITVRQFGFLVSSLSEVQESYEPDKEGEPWALYDTQLNQDEMDDLDDKLGELDQIANPELYANDGSGEDDDDEFDEASDFGNLGSLDKDEPPVQISPLL